MQKILLKYGTFKANLDPSLNRGASAVPLGDSTAVIRWHSCGLENILRVLCSQPPKSTHIRMGGQGDRALFSQGGSSLSCRKGVNVCSSEARWGPAGVKCKEKQYFCEVPPQRGAWKGNTAAAMSLTVGDPTSLPWQSVNT